MNFNTTKFFNYLVGQIINSVSEEDSPKAQCESLNICRKSYSICICELRSGFQLDSPCIDKQVNDWIKNELKICYKRMKIYNNQQLPIQFKEKSKLKTSLTVSELASLFRLLKQNGIIVNKTEKDICTAISQMFSTERTDEISLDSVHNRYYTEDSPAKEKVKKLLLKIGYSDN